MVRLEKFGWMVQRVMGRNPWSTILMIGLVLFINFNPGPSSFPMLARTLGGSGMKPVLPGLLVGLFSTAAMSKLVTQIVGESTPLQFSLGENC